MALSTGDLPYTSVHAIGVGGEARITVDFSVTDDTGSISNADLAEGIRQALLASPQVDAEQPITATHHSVEDTEI